MKNQNHGQIINLFVEAVYSDKIILNTQKDLGGDVFEMYPEEQLHKLSVGSEILAILFLSELSKNIEASMHLEKHANQAIKNLKPQQEVDLFVIQETDLGYKCIIDGKHIGLLYKNEVFKPVKKFDQLKGYIKNIRDDQRLDLILRAAGHKATQDIWELILELLKNNNGILNVTDRTPPEDIYNMFGVSKKKFKIALGQLYKNRKIIVSETHIQLVK